MIVTCEIRRLHPEAILPTYQTSGAAGVDLVACIATPVELSPGARYLVPTGIAISIPEDYEGQVRPRSGLAHHHGITVLNAPGTIDSDYRGEIKVVLINLSSRPYVIQPGARIAQLVLTPVARITWLEVSGLSNTVRDDGSFGHSGV